MRRGVFLAALLLLLASSPASADAVATCEGSAGLEWTTCDGQAHAQWRKLTVRYCLGEGDLGFFTGQLTVKVTSQHGGYAQIGDDDPDLVVAGRGCLEDSIGGSTLHEGAITWLVEARGTGFYSVSVLVA